MPTPTLVHIDLADPITSPHRYREVRPEIDGFRLVSAVLTVTLLEPRRARYEYACVLETLGEIPARYWCYHLPADIGDVADLRAWDAGGRLSARLLPAHAPGTRLEVRLRRPITTGERYAFTFGYEAAIGAVVAAHGRVRTVTFADWVIFNIPCAELEIRVELPPGADYVTAVPAPVEAIGGIVTWRVRALRALETVAVTLAYRLTTRSVRQRMVRRLRGLRP